MDIYILRDGKQQGPFSEETTHQMLKQGVVLINDPAWRPGMPEWIPLHSVLYPAPPNLPPAAPASEAPLPVVSTEPATEKQKVFLRYVGIPFPGSLSKEEATLLVDGAMENPKNAQRVARWNDDRLKLHPDLFAAELQAKKAERPQRFHELCQTEGAEMVEGITKAHCQVLVGYLDGKFPNWDASSESEAARKYFFPAVAEKFPQFVRADWKGKLQYPESPKVAPEAKGRATAVPVRASSPKRKASSPVASLFKGLILGLLLVGLGAGGFYAYKHPEVVAQAKEQFAQLQAKYLKKGSPTSAKAGASPAPAEEKPTLSSDATPSGTQASAAPEPVKPPAETKPAETAADAMATTTPTDPTMASAPAPELPEAAPASNNGNMSLFDPNPSPAPGTMAGDPTAGGLPAPKTTATLLQPMELQLTYGKIKVPAGTQLPIVEQDGTNLKVRFQNQVLSIPVTATDLGGDGFAQ